MSEHFIREIEIKNFKCFKDFKAEGFKWVNLIGGKNNVGKTAFMEACYINVYAQNLKAFTASLFNIKFMRENLNILNGDKYETRKYIEQSNNIFTKSNINLATFKIEDINGIKEYIFEFNKKNIKVNSNLFSYDIKWIENIQFIDNFGLSNIEIINFYVAIQKKKEEQFLNDILHKFDNRIESFKIMIDKPTCEIDGEYCEITELGDGVRHLVSIVTALFSCENGQLFIDEIDNGIHYIKLDKIWKIIFELSEKLNVQVFATTHSKEMIESFNRVQLKIELEDNESSYFELAKNIKTDEIFMSEIDKNLLKYGLSHKARIRGE